MRERLPSEKVRVFEEVAGSALRMQEELRRTHTSAVGQSRSRKSARTLEPTLFAFRFPFQVSRSDFGAC